jgi:ABC-2 type transport system permease protein
MNRFLLATFGLYKREVKRMIRIYQQTLFAPAVNGIIMVLIFGIVIKGGGSQFSQLATGNLSVYDFIVSGVLAMTIIQNSFGHASTSIVMPKMIGYLNDYLMPPITASMVLLAFFAACVTRALLAAAVFLIVAYFVVGFNLQHIWAMLFISIVISGIGCCLGIITGVFADNIEKMTIVQNYFIAPLSMLSGTFYGVKDLPLIWQKIVQFNPFFYMIDAVRYCFTNFSTYSIKLELTILILMLVFLSVVSLVLTSLKMFNLK